MERVHRILVIDDDEDFRSSVRSLLEAEGCEVLTADSGHEGLELAREARPDLIILDIMMENTAEGYVVNQALKFCREYEGCADTPVIMCSSITTPPEELYPRAGELGMITPNAYLTKPLDIARLLETIKRLLPHAVHA
jgi:CheY-like chemotaxis protein